MFLIYGISDCPHCLRAAADLMERDKQYVYIEMDFAKDYREMIKQKFDWTTYPIIVTIINGEEKIIGGYQELLTYLTS